MPIEERFLLLLMQQIQKHQSFHQQSLLELNAMITAGLQNSLMSIDAVNLRFLLDKHANLEEQAMQEVDYPDSQAHIVDHVCINKLFNRTVEDPKHWPVDELIKRILNHIEQHDLKFSKYLSSIRTL